MSKVTVELNIQPVPMKTVPNWVAVAEYTKANGEMILPANVERNSAHAALHRLGCGIRAIVVDGEVVACRVRPLPTKTKTKTKHKPKSKSDADASIDRSST
jgi:hypothetical protein